jgi:hypothetical protein
MLALQRQVRASWLATLENDTALCREHGLEIDLEPLGIEVAFALVAVRVLDLEVFDGRNDRAYQAHRASCTHGRVVDGMTLLRNAEIHFPGVIDPEIARAVSVPILREGEHWPFNGQFRVFPTWRPFQDLPEAVQKSAQTAERCKISYRTHLASALVIDSLLDAVRFFYECDPSLAMIDDKGELLHFPFPAVLVDGDRRHPLSTAS